ncbi:MAG: 3-oxoacyl-(acyl-carrier-protein) reductase FabG [bacterium ADurb.Bin243]|nr:MAG: 3-oxoacyl-(acyl-carrier-protein) reductase FabG [bacterium ADurb.Bin243]HOD41103.1 glucose 1-dehydrogenase [Candidatus Wallbacteria bacterium]
MKKNTEAITINLKGKAAIVTGASRGIGRAIAVKFAEAGADVCVVYKNSDSEAASALREIEAFGVKGLKIKCDAADSAQAKAAVEETIDKFGKIDILVNNAAVTDNLPFLALEAGEWQKAVDVNVNSVYNFTHPVIHHMKDRRSGRILNIGSICGIRPIAAVPVHYASTKGAVNAFTFTLAREVARYNILVNSIAPGLVETDFAAGLPDVRMKDFEKFCPLARPGKPSEIANFALFIVSDLNTYMTGETVIISGGL